METHVGATAATHSGAKVLTTTTLLRPRCAALVVEVANLAPISRLRRRRRLLSILMWRLHPARRRLDANARVNGRWLDKTIALSVAVILTAIRGATGAAWWIQTAKAKTGDIALRSPLQLTLVRQTLHLAQMTNALTPMPARQIRMATFVGSIASSHGGVLAAGTTMTISRPPRCAALVAAAPRASSRHTLQRQWQSRIHLRLPLRLVLAPTPTAPRATGLATIAGRMWITSSGAAITTMTTSLRPPCAVLAAAAARVRTLTRILRRKATLPKRRAQTVMQKALVMWMATIASSTPQIRSGAWEILAMTTSPLLRCAALVGAEAEAPAPLRLGRQAMIQKQHAPTPTKVAPVTRMATTARSTPPTPDGAWATSATMTSQLR